MKKSESRKLQDKDRVICLTNPLVKNKVFTVQNIPESLYIRLYQVNPNVLFTKKGECVAVNINSCFKVGDRLQFFKSYHEYL